MLAMVCVYGVTYKAKKVKAPIWQYFGFKPNLNNEPVVFNEGEGVGYLTEKMQPVACSSSFSICSITSDCIKLFPEKYQIDPCNKCQK